MKILINTTFHYNSKNNPSFDNEKQVLVSLNAHCQSGHILHKAGARIQNGNEVIIFCKHRLAFPIKTEEKTLLKQLFQNTSVKTVLDCTEALIDKRLVGYDSESVDFNTSTRSSFFSCFK